MKRPGERSRLISARHFCAQDFVTLGDNSALKLFSFNVLLHIIRAKIIEFEIELISCIEGWFPSERTKSMNRYFCINVLAIKEPLRLQFRSIGIFENRNDILTAIVTVCTSGSESPDVFVTGGNFK